MGQPTATMDPGRSEANTPSDVDALAADITAASEARAGDREAFRRLYQSFAPMVHAILLARAPAADVDDLVQDVFAVARQRLAELREAANFGPWIASIARRRAVDPKQVEPLRRDLQTTLDRLDAIAARLEELEKKQVQRNVEAKARAKFPRFRKTSLGVQYPPRL